MQRPLGFCGLLLKLLPPRLDPRLHRLVELPNRPATGPRIFGNLGSLNPSLLGGNQFVRIAQYPLDFAVGNVDVTLGGVEQPPQFAPDRSRLIDRYSLPRNRQVQRARNDRESGRVKAEEPLD